MNPRSTGQWRRRDVLCGGLAGLAAGLGGCRASARAIEGRIVDTDVDVGHRVREALQRSPTRTESVPVCIAGGGVSGASAAWRLAREGGPDFVLLDLAASIGGNARGGVTEGLAHPWGAHYLPVPHRSQQALVAFLRDAGFVQGFDEQGRCQVPVEHLVRAPHERLCALGHWDEGLWPRGGSAQDTEQWEHFQSLVDEHAAQTDASGRLAFALPLASSGESARALDRETASAWCARHGLDGSRIRWWLEYATRDDYGSRLEDVSAYALLHYFCARRSLTGGVPGEFMTWPEGNARLVRHLIAPDDARIRPRSLVVSVAAQGPGGPWWVDALDLETDELVRWVADHVVLAMPQHVVRRVLRDDPAADARASFRGTPWVVANVLLESPPTSRGFPAAWDNVLLRSASLGFVDATHQLDRVDQTRLWTWYRPLADDAGPAARERLLAEPWETWRDEVLRDLRHGWIDAVDRVRRIDVWRWGHAMVKPVPGFLWGGERAAAGESVGTLHVAHSDVAGLPLFEEAHWVGNRAAERILTAAGVAHEVWSDAS